MRIDHKVKVRSWLDLIRRILIIDIEVQMFSSTPFSSPIATTSNILCDHFIFYIFAAWNVDFWTRHRPRNAPHSNQNRSGVILCNRSKHLYRFTYSLLIYNISRKQDENEETPPNSSLDDSNQAILDLHSAPESHLAQTDKKRFIFREWPRNPDGPIICETPTGKQASNGLQLWGA